jgi:hypothetical protein
MESLNTSAKAEASSAVSAIPNCGKGINSVSNSENASVFG